MTAWIYCRVSSAEQAADGGSLPVQAEECQKYCQRNRLQLGKASNYRNPGVFADPGVSAWKTNLLTRPGFQKLWNNTQRGDTIVFPSLDRGFRSVLDFSTTWSTFESSGINSVFVHDRIDMTTPTGKLIAHMTAAFAQFKSDLISQRVREALAIKRRRKEQDGDTSVKKKKKLTQADNAVLGSIVDDELPETVVRGRVFGYTRVSTKDQDISGQEELVRDRVAGMVENGYEGGGKVIGDFGVSAFSVDWKHRPGGKVLWDQLKPNDCVVVLRVDRIFRSMLDMSRTMKELNDRGVHLVTCCGIDTRTEHGRQAIEVLSMMAAWESRDISWRMKLICKHRRKLKGKWRCPEALPRWMKAVHFDEDSWAAHPDMHWIDQYREVEELLNEGYSYRKASQLMEERLAFREMRPVLPPIRFSKDRVIDRAYRDDIPLIYRWSLEDWFKTRTPDANGEYDRDWSENRIHLQRRYFKEIDAVLNADESSSV